MSFKPLFWRFWSLFLCFSGRILCVYFGVETRSELQELWVLLSFPDHLAFGIGYYLRVIFQAFVANLDLTRVFGYVIIWMA